MTYRDRAAAIGAEADGAIQAFADRLQLEQEAHADTRAELDAEQIAHGQLQQEYADHMAAEHAPPVDPKAALRDAWGVGVHATFASRPAWADVDAWMKEVDAIGFTQIRSMCNPIGNTKAAINSRRVLELCRQYGVKWLMLLVPEDWSVTAAEAAARMKWLHDNGWHDVVLGFEGPNEPDHERGGGSPPATWPQDTVNIVKAMKDARDRYFPGVPIASPSLHDVNQDRLNGDGYKKLAALGIADLVDVVSLHSYPRGNVVTTGLEDRIKLADLAYAGKPVWLSETGWTTYKKVGTGGHASTTEADAAIYGAAAPQSIIDHPRVEKAFRFELRDDPPSGESTDSETRFGIVRPDGSWKPEATALKALLA